MNADLRATIKFNSKKHYLRELGFTESLISEIHAIVVNIAEIEGHVFDIDILKKSLDAVVDLQPNLRINIDFNSTPRKFYTISDPYIDPILVESDNPEAWKTLAEERMNNLFTYGEQNTLFRFVILQMKISKIAYFFVELDHSISDGTSGMILLNDILKFYVKFLEDNLNSCSIENNYLTINKIKSLKFLPNLEKLAFPDGIKPDDFENILKMKDKINPKPNKEAKPLVKTLELNPIENKDEFLNGKYNKNYPLFYEGSHDNLIALKQFCKGNHFTVGAMLMAACSFQIAKSAYEVFFKNQEKIKIPFNFNVNLRHRLEPQFPKEHVALLISIAKLELEFDKNINFLDLSKLVSERLNSLLSSKEFFYEIEANRIILENNLKESVEIEKDNFSQNDLGNKLICPAVSANLNLSNLGFYPFDSIYKLKSQELFKVKSLKCVGSPWTPSFSHYLLLIHSVDYMNYSFVYYGKENKNYAKEFLNGIIYLTENCPKLGDLTLNQYANSQNQTS